MPLDYYVMTLFVLIKWIFKFFLWNSRYEKHPWLILEEQVQKIESSLFSSLIKLKLKRENFINSEQTWYENFWLEID